MSAPAAASGPVPRQATNLSGLTSTAPPGPRPRAVPIRVGFARAVIRLRLDDQQYGAIGNGLTRTTADDAGPGYGLIVAGAADTVTMTTA